MALAHWMNGRDSSCNCSLRFPSPHGGEQPDSRAQSQSNASFKVRRLERKNHRLPNAAQAEPRTTQVDVDASEALFWQVGQALKTCPCRFNIGRALGGWQASQIRSPTCVFIPSSFFSLITGPNQAMRQWPMQKRTHSRLTQASCDRHMPPTTCQATSPFNRLRARQIQCFPQSAHIQTPKSGRVTGVVQAGNWSLKDMHLGLGLFTLATF